MRQHSVRGARLRQFRGRWNLFAVAEHRQCSVMGTARRLVFKQPLGETNVARHYARAWHSAVSPTSGDRSALPVKLVAYILRRVAQLRSVTDAQLRRSSLEGLRRARLPRYTRGDNEVATMRAEWVKTTHRENTLCRVRVADVARAYRWIRDARKDYPDDRRLDAAFAAL